MFLKTKKSKLSLYVMKKRQSDILNFLISEVSEGSLKNELEVSLKEYLIVRRSRIRDEIVRLSNKLDEIDNLLEYYDSFIIESSESLNNLYIDDEKSFDVYAYRTKDYWRRFAYQMLEELNMFVSSSEIMNASITPKNERRQVMSILSIVLSEMTKSGKLSKIKVEGKRGYYYGIPNIPTIIKR